MAPGKSDNRQVPRILIFGHREFSHLVSSVLLEFQTEAEFKIVDYIVDNSTALSSHISAFNPDVVVSPGSNAVYLKSVLDLPIISLDVTESDIVEAVIKAAAVTDNILMISFDPPQRILPHLERSMGIKITHKHYQTPEEARELFYIASKQPWGAIVGASLVCGLATQEDFKSFLFYSRQSCRQMVIKAIAAGRRYRESRNSQALSNWVIKHAKSLFLIADSRGQLLQINEAVKAELHLEHNNSTELVDLIKRHHQLQSSDGEWHIDGQNWWFHRDEVKDGLQEPMYIYQLYKKKSTMDESSSHAIEASSELRYRSRAMIKVMETINSFSRSPSNILITGESGTGKELIARAIYQASMFSNGQFVGINCGAIPSELFEGELFGYHDGAFTGSKRGGRKGLIEAATNGVLFLDEVSELTLEQQTKLLRFLQERTIRRLGGNEETPITLKVVAASNRSLREMVAQKTFREDLYYRLNVFNIELPPLRARKDDIDCIALSKLEYFLEEYKIDLPAQDILHEVSSLLMEYSWPGNVRELENVIERIVAHLLVYPDYHNSSDVLRTIAPELFSDFVHDSNCGNRRARELQMVVQAMDEFQHDKHKVAEYLGISQTTLWRRLKQLKSNT